MDTVKAEGDLEKEGSIVISMTFKTGKLSQGLSFFFCRKLDYLAII